MTNATTYTLISTKGRRTVTGTIGQAVRAARAMDAELQPAHGVTIEDADRNTVAEIDEGRIEAGAALLERIESLRTNAATAGDLLMVGICQLAIDGEIGERVALDAAERAMLLDRYAAEGSALAECVRVIADAEAQA